MAKRIPLQGVLPLTKRDKLANRQWRERAEGKKVRRLPGRPPSKRSGVSHHGRPTLGPKSALHITLKATRAVPNLRARRRFAVIKNAFVKFCAPKELGFRLIHFAVLSNHLHFVVEADSKRALSLGMQKLLHSISRRLNALSLREHGQSQSTKAGNYRKLPGWLGRVFADRYHAHLLRSPTEMQNAVHYVRTNADKHYSGGEVHTQSVDDIDPCSSFAFFDVVVTSAAKGFLLKRVCDAEKKTALS
jgi:REP element-mobilizing transposase RayT